MAKGGMPKLVQAKDVPETVILGEVYSEAKGTVDAGFVSKWQLQEVLKISTGIEYPLKVISAKCNAMRRQKLIQGCACGCRGDWRLARKGKDLVEYLVQEFVKQEKHG